MSKIDQLREVYLMMLEVHSANIQILKNQKYILRQFRTENPNKTFKQPNNLIEETDNILRIITSGKYKS